MCVLFSCWYLWKYQIRTCIHTYWSCFCGMGKMLCVFWVRRETTLSLALLAYAMIWHELIIGNLSCMTVKKTRKTAWFFCFFQSCPRHGILDFCISWNLDVLPSHRPGTAEVRSPALRAGGRGAERPGQEAAGAPRGERSSAAGRGVRPLGRSPRRCRGKGARPGPGRAARGPKRWVSAAEGRGPGGAPAPAVPGRGGERRWRRRAGRCPPWPLLISPVWCCKACPGICSCDGARGRRAGGPGEEVIFLAALARAFFFLPPPFFFFFFFHFPPLAP